jgi:2,4-dienoyl-CoA reductase-like NADH-dependent reductase (Old Yellow Enzyme family)
MFTSLTLDSLHLRNRIVHSPFTENLAARDGAVTPAMLDYYVGLAREGCGLILVESAYVAQQGRATLNQLGISEERHSEGLAQLVKAVKAEGGAIGIRLAHAGARTSELICGEQPVGPSIINFGKDFDVSREFDEGDVEEFCLFFTHAAERAEEAGFDLVEINGTQQYLLDQCLSARTNNRLDAYGGSIEERMRLSVDILKAIKARIQPKTLVSYVFSIHDKLEDGFAEEDLRGMIRCLVAAKVDLLHPVSIHVLNKFFDTEETLVEWVGKFTKKPIVADGNIKSPQILKEAMSLGRASLYALDKTLFVRPNWYQFLQKKILPQPA